MHRSTPCKISLSSPKVRDYVGKEACIYSYASYKVNHIQKQFFVVILIELVALSKAVFTQFS